MNTNDDLVSKFIKQAKTDNKVTPPAPARKTRIGIGLLISIFIATIYGLIAETINFTQAPGLPLYFHPFGTVGNIIYSIFLGALVGIAIAWSEKATSGMIAGGFVIFIGIEISLFLSSTLYFSSLLTTMLGFFALISIAFEIVVLTLLAGLIRWAIDMQHERSYLKIWHWQRSLPILALIGIAITAGYLHKIPDGWVYSLRTANKLIQEGIKAKTSSDLPKGLNDEYLGDFLTYASDGYKLEVNNLLQPIFFSVYPGVEISFRDNIVIIYFESGQDIACLISGGRTPKCIRIIRKLKFPPIIF